MTLPDLDFLSSTNISDLRKKKDNNDYFHHHFYYYTILFFIFVALNHCGRASAPKTYLPTKKSRFFTCLHQGLRRIRSYR